MVTAKATKGIGRPAQLEYILRNATGHPVSLRNASGEVITIGAASSTSIALKQLSRRITVTCTETARHITIDFPLVRPRSNKIADLASGAPSSPFAVYTFRHKALGLKRPTILILPRRNLAAFLGDFNDGILLSSLLLPGSHDSVAYYGFPFSQCQSPALPFLSQLRSGIRTLDIRLAVIHISEKDPRTGKPITKLTLAAFHSFISQRVSFSTILGVIKEFLQENKTECIVMSLKQEDSQRTPEWTFSQLVKEAVDADRKLWFLENRIPHLGEVRGKIVLFSRFSAAGVSWPGGDENGLGIHPTAWPDSLKEGFEWHVRDGTIARTHDWYNIGSFLSIPEKFVRAASNLLVRPSTPEIECGKKPSLRISYTSAFTFPFALPPLVAVGIKWGPFGWTGVNQRVVNWLLHRFACEHERVALMTLEERHVNEKLNDKEDVSASSEELHHVGNNVVRNGSMDDDDTKVRGWVMLDFVDQPSDLLPLLVECNYQ